MRKMTVLDRLLLLGTGLLAAYQVVVGGRGAGYPGGDQLYHRLRCPFSRLFVVDHPGFRDFGKSAGGDRVHHYSDQPVFGTGGGIPAGLSHPIPGFCGPGFPGGGGHPLCGPWESRCDRAGDRARDFRFIDHLPAGLSQREWGDIARFYPGRYRRGSNRNWGIAVIVPENRKTDPAEGYHPRDPSGIIIPHDSLVCGWFRVGVGHSETGFANTIGTVTAPDTSLFCDNLRTFFPSSNF